MLLLVDVVEHPKLITGSESKFPCRLKEHGPFQRFAIPCCDIRFMGQPFLNGDANERIVFGLDRSQLSTGDRGIENRERMLWRHGD